MSNPLINKLYLFFWEKTSRKIDNGRIRITHSYESYGGTVYDLYWKITLYNNKKGIAAKHVVQDRANKSNIINVIKQVERKDLLEMIRKMSSTGKHSS